MNFKTVLKFGKIFVKKVYEDWCENVERNQNNNWSNGGTSNANAEYYYLAKVSCGNAGTTFQYDYYFNEPGKRYDFVCDVCGGSHPWQTPEEDELHQELTIDAAHRITYIATNRKV